MQSLADALSHGDDPHDRAELRGAPSCDDDAHRLLCLDLLTRFFGASGELTPHHPAQADLAAIAFSQVPGSTFEDAGPFLGIVDNGSGLGADIFRLALAARLRDEARMFPKTIGAPDSAEYLDRVGRTVFGACATYSVLGRNPPLATLTPELHPDTSRCVARDLGRPLGPGATFSKGTHRAVSAADALVRTLANALRNGVLRMKTGDAKVRELSAEIDARLANVAVSATDWPIEERTN